MKKIITLVVASTSLLLSCSSSDKSNKFIGTWKSLSTTDRGWIICHKKLIIEKSGENFTIQISNWMEGAQIPEGYKSWTERAAKEIDKDIASYDKEHDKLNVGSGFTAASIIFDTKSGHILTGSSEYEKIK